MSEAGTDWTLGKEPSDDEIRLLFAIVRDASSATEAPFKSFFASYDRHFVQRGLDKAHDNVIYRLGMRVVHAARRQHHAGRPTNMVPYLISILESHGITCIEDDGVDVTSDLTRQLELAEARKRASSRKSSRRLSFDDAGLEESWLSQHVEPIGSTAAAVSHDSSLWTSQESRRKVSDQRSRSMSNQSSFEARHMATKHLQEDSPSSEQSSEEQGHHQRTLMFELSQTQLEMNAEAFLATSQLRFARRCIRALHDRCVSARVTHSRALQQAIHKDRSMLLGATLSDLVARCKRNKQQRLAIAELERLELQHIEHLEVLLSDRMRVNAWNLLSMAASHLNITARDQRQATKVALLRGLQIKYFKKWRDISIDNNIKARIILSRKYLRRWRDRLAHSLLAHEQATAHYEETLLGKCLSRWFRTHQYRETSQQYEKKLCRSNLHSWHDRLLLVRRQGEEAEDMQYLRSVRNAFQTLSCTFENSLRRQATAQHHHERVLSGKYLEILHAAAKIRPLERQADDVARKRILQTAWTNWNDSLRTRALGQRIDQRILIENLRAWALSQRLRTYQRQKDARLAQRSINTWHRKTQQSRTTLEEAEAMFAESQHNRRARFAIMHLNMAIRSREDAERTAIEFANGRTLPKVFERWRGQSDQVRSLTKWATDARFYCLCTKTLQAWRHQTIEHQARRRRDAYRQIRAKIKTRIITQCLTTWRDQIGTIKSMEAEAERAAGIRLNRVGTDAFDSWRHQAAKLREIDEQAVAFNSRKVAAEALFALVVRVEDLAGNEQQALLFRQESDLAALAGVVRKIQWASFTTARQAESANALRARNRDQHVKQMIRHWALQASQRKLQRQPAEQRDADSPSLRPASRMAARSADRPTVSSSPPTASFQSTAAGYMRTPSRPRRLGRFRPLPTPSHVTPMTFTPAYLITTPAPMAAALPADYAGETSDVFGSSTPEVTNFSRRLRAGGVTPAPVSVLRSSVFGRSIVGTNKSVRFAASSRFSGSQK